LFNLKVEEIAEFRVRVRVLSCLASVQYIYIILRVRVRVLGCLTSVELRVRVWVRVRVRLPLFN
jgi:hypothetical protein